VESLLFGVTPDDPLTCGGVALLLALVSLLAAYLPARSAARIDWPLLCVPSSWPREAPHAM
jgi:hypothetical protein